MNKEDHSLEDKKRITRKVEEYTILDFARIRHFPRILRQQGHRILTEDENKRLTFITKMYLISKWTLFSIVPVCVKLGSMKSDQPRTKLRKLAAFQLLYVFGATYFFGKVAQKHWKEVEELSERYMEQLDR